MTLNSVMAVYFAELGSFGPYYAKVVEDTPIHSASEMYVCMYLFYSSKNNTTEAL